MNQSRHRPHLRQGAAKTLACCCAALMLAVSAPVSASPVSAATDKPRPGGGLDVLDAVSDLLAGLSAGLMPLLPTLRGPMLPANDLEAIVAGLTGAQLAVMKSPVVAPHPELQPVPRANCDANSRPLKGMQGRVPLEAIVSPAAERGWTCNLTEVSHYRTPGGFRVWRYTDREGRTCAYYDTSLMAPLNIVSALAGPSLGVVVLDMTDPANPVRTATLTSLAMLSPHESLNLNAKRGLLVAAAGSALTLPGSMAVYDVSGDCRHPELLSQKPTLFGHESGFSPDGNTFWIAGGAGYIEAVDVSNPRQPATIWKGAYYSHGLSLSDDGNVLYQTDPINGNLGILDVSQIQGRDLDPVVTDISRITWDSVSIPQNTVPFSSDGRDYLLEFDEFAFRFNPTTIDDQVGAARIIEISDPSAPRIVSNLRLEVNERANHRAASIDPSPLPPTQVFGYSTHYCNVPRHNDPQIAACSSTTSGLRVFDISDPASPREVAYFVAPPKDGKLLGLLPGNLALSQPAFDPEHRQVWYTDAGSGFYALELSDAAWPR